MDISKADTIKGAVGAYAIDTPPNLLRVRALLKRNYNLVAQLESELYAP